MDYDFASPIRLFIRKREKPLLGITYPSAVGTSRLRRMYDPEIDLDDYRRCGF
jgi:hypothetical protein